jgi:hypothetical protein
MYKDAIDWFVHVNDLRDAQLSSEEWGAIQIASNWLKLFRTATTLMSSSKETTISWVYLVFTRLQDHVRTQLATLSDTVPLELKIGLYWAHNKLTQYFALLYRSPYYLWASSMLIFFPVPCAHDIHPVLDPQIMYSGLISKFKDEDDLLSDITAAKIALEDHFQKCYAITSQSVLNGSAPTHVKRNETLDFIGDFSGSVDQPSTPPFRELSEFFSLRPEPMSTCDLMQWWAGRQSQFPCLSQMARNIFLIPGMYSYI